MAEKIKGADGLELVRKVRDIEKCRKCECMKETLLSIHDALRGTGRDREMEVLLLEVEDALEALLETEYT